MIDRYRVENGTYVDGAPAINALRCSAHWFETHPAYKDGGLVAIGYYEHGTHLLNVSGQGESTRKGYFLPHAGSTSAAFWVNRNVIYAVDYTRGIDILRYNGPGTNGPITSANQRGSGRGQDQAKLPGFHPAGSSQTHPDGLTSGSGRCGVSDFFEDPLRGGDGV